MKRNPVFDTPKPLNTDIPEFDKLTLKQKGFVKDYILTKNGTRAVLNNYDTTDENIAAALANENKRKPKIQNAIRALGFSEEGAKQVVQELLYNKKVKPVDRISAAREVFKVSGSYAPEKHNVGIFSLVTLGQEQNTLIDGNADILAITETDDTDEITQ